MIVRVATRALPPRGTNATRTATRRIRARVSARNPPALSLIVRVAVLAALRLTETRPSVVFRVRPAVLTGAVAVAVSVPAPGYSTISRRVPRLAAAVTERMRNYRESASEHRRSIRCPVR